MTTRTPRSLLPLVCVVSAVAVFSLRVTTADSIGQNGLIITGNQTLVSPGNIFKLGFFVPSGAAAGRMYLGIWYASTPVQTVVWVANRQDPVVNTPAVVRLSTEGCLVIVDGQNATVWSSPAPARNVTAGAAVRLSDNGNFVLSSDGSFSPDSVAWQSFDYPTDTLLPGMKLGVDLCEICVIQN